MRLPRGLYAITDGAPDIERLSAAVTAALRGGAVVIQYRDKSSDHARRETEAKRLCAVCHAHGARFIVNDDVMLAAECGADGVHLGKDDSAFHEARRRLGAEAIIGVSCYNELARAEHAVQLGADYVAFGSFYGSTVKPEAVRAAPELLTEAKRRWDVPVVAIGGITPENGAALVAAGADLLAVITGVFGAADVTAAARRYTELFTDGAQTRAESA